MFVTIEGIDGSGKTYLTKLITDWLNAEEPGSTISTSEPYDRTLVDNKDEWESKAFYRDRIIHFSAVIATALDADKNVICDRFQLSSVVYQGFDDVLFTDVWNKYAYYVLGPDRMRTLSRMNYGVLEPDCVILIDRRLSDCIRELEDRGELKSDSAYILESNKNKFKRAVFAFENATRWCLTEATTIIVAQTADEAFERFKEYCKGYTDKHSEESTRD